MILYVDCLNRVSECLSLLSESDKEVFFSEVKNLIKIIKQEKQTRLRFIEDAKKKSLLIDMEMAS